MSGPQGQTRSLQDSLLVLFLLVVDGRCATADMMATLLLVDTCVQISIVLEEDHGSYDVFALFQLRA